MAKKTKSPESSQVTNRSNVRATAAAQNKLRPGGGLERRLSWLSECTTTSDMTERSVLVVRDGIILERQIAAAAAGGEDNSQNNSPTAADDESSYFSHASSMGNYYRTKKEASSSLSDRFRKDALGPTMPAINLMDPSTWMMFDEDEDEQKEG